jgi:hypothetical protein
VHVRVFCLINSVLHTHHPIQLIELYCVDYPCCLKTQHHYSLPCAFTAINSVVWEYDRMIEDIHVTPSRGSCPLNRAIKRVTVKQIITLEAIYIPLYMRRRTLYALRLQSFGHNDTQNHKFVCGQNEGEVCIDNLCWSPEKLETPEARDTDDDL